MPIHPYSLAVTEAQYGRIELEPETVQPLDEVRVRLSGREGGGGRVIVRVCDPLQRPYAEREVALRANQGEAVFSAAGTPGAHYVYLLYPGETRWSRYHNFEVSCPTRLESGDPDFDGIFPLTRQRMRLGRRSYQTPRGRFIGYISADTWHFDGIWLRDSFYGLPAYRYWEPDLASGLDRFLEMQAENGMLPDGIERSGRTWRVGLESDVEYIMTLAVWMSWQASGDDVWLRAALPRLERALAYIRSDPKHWDEQHRLVKRQHSCDTWDFDIDGASDRGEARHVIATCDQSGYYQAFAAMGWMYAALGEAEKAAEWQAYAEAYRQRAVNLLWDGVKFQHHVHIDPIDHDGFDESAQLAMGNTTAVTRGLASPAQARSIVDEYRRRQAATGDAFPWWSLQPGYPNELGYFREEHRKQGGYANGGLMPWVGGELCRAAFECGREAYAVELLRQYAAHLRATGGAHVWYWPDGTPGFRTTNEVNYAGWGMAQWSNALLAGLAGVEDASARLGLVRCSPRWAAAGIRSARVQAGYAASEAGFAYQYAAGEGTLTLRFTGSGERVDFHVLLPAGWRLAGVTLNGAAAPASEALVDASRYVDFSAPLAGVNEAQVRCRVE